MTYLVTGAGGNLGRYVISQFLSAGHDVIGIDIKSSSGKRNVNYLKKIAKNNNKNLTIRWLDLVNYTALEKIFMKNQKSLKGIIHLAFIIPPFSEMNPTKTHEIHLSTMNNLITLTEKFAPTAAFVFTSSTTVFAPPHKLSDIIDIDHPVKGLSQYTKDKIDCENLLSQSKLNWKILRLSVIMNPIFRPKKESTHYGLLIDLNTLVEPVHAADVATAIFHASTFPNIPQKIFIISGGEKNRMTYREYIFGMLHAIINDLKMEDVPWHLFTGQKKNYLHWYDTKESQNLLNFQTKSFDDYCIEMKKELYWWERLGAYLLKKKVINKYFEQ